MIQVTDFAEFSKTFDFYSNLCLLTDFFSLHIHCLAVYVMGKYAKNLNEHVLIAHYTSSDLIECYRMDLLSEITVSQTSSYLLEHIDNEK